MDGWTLIAVRCPGPGLTGGAVLFGFSRSLMIFYVLVCSAQKLHDAMFAAVIRTPVHFFDVNPIGESPPPAVAATCLVNLATLTSIFGGLLGRKSPQQVLQGYRPDGFHAAHHLRGLLPSKVFLYS